MANSVLLPYSAWPQLQQLNPKFKPNIFTSTEEEKKNAVSLFLWCCTSATQSHNLKIIISEVLVHCKKSHVFGRKVVAEKTITVGGYDPSLLGLHPLRGIWGAPVILRGHSSILHGNQEKKLLSSAPSLIYKEQKYLLQINTV